MMSKDFEEDWPRRNGMELHLFYTIQLSRTITMTS